MPKLIFQLVVLISLLLALLGPMSPKETADASASLLSDHKERTAINDLDKDYQTVVAAGVSVGGQHTCGLTASGGVKCWGKNDFGQLGDGTFTNRSTPMDVVGLSSGVSAIAAGYSHTCALTTDGGVKCWGNNNATPVDVAGLTSGVSAISAGFRHTCAVTTSGGVKCWGQNNYGQLGDGTTTSRFGPVDVVGLASGVTATAAGEFHTCALTTAGGVKCWGENGSGQLGDGTNITRLTPVDVSGLPSGVSTIVAGEFHNCVITTLGGVKCWGGNNGGQLGDGTTSSRSTPVDVVGLASVVSAVSAGGSHTCAVAASGEVKCWGINDFGQLGDGTTTRRSTPVDVAGLVSGVSAIVSRWGHTCVVTTSGGIKCWGYNKYGQLGDDTTTDRSTPVNVAGLYSGVSAVDVGFHHTCVLTTAGGVKCWGDNSGSQLGDGTAISHSTPVDVIGLANEIEAITTGSYHTCALTTAGGVKCWGQLGVGAPTFYSTPVDVAGLTSGVSAVDAGTDHTCALTTAGGVKCWGYNSYGQLGDGTTTDRPTPVDVVGLTSGVSAISAGIYFTCALTDVGGVKCWGSNYYGQLGDDTSTNRSTPVDVLGMVSGTSAVTAGSDHTCALTTAGGVKCWGYNYYGQLGDGTASPRYTPVDVVGLTSGVRAVAAGYYHTCALTTAGGAKCWGNNLKAQLGDGTTINRSTPVDVEGLASGTNSIAAGEYHTCALTTSGGAKCWGYNDFGQLGWKNLWVPVNVIGFGEESSTKPLYLPLLIKN